MARLVSQNIGNRICLIPLPTHFHMDYQRHACLAFSVPPSQYCRYGNINPFPIDYAFLPRLRGRLTLLRLTLSRNPWSFGEGVSHSLYRYSCQHSHFRYLQQPSRVRLHRLTERSATTCLTAYPQLRCMALAPLHFRRKDPYLDQ